MAGIKTVRMSISICLEDIRVTQLEEWESHIVFLSPHFADVPVELVALSPVVRHYPHKRLWVKALNSWTFNEYG